ncbi:phospholipase C, phosphocholine-specific [Novosphingobium sp. 1949]|uniref:phospholipase C n=1 Tax=Novosphingobium organovorum TaxID=2930092 RepID=A0ABT0BEY5_9SPHN|nr:phospholipase C, phosphocholine-specific [Novosphingobium organovorum]MCJ2183594.1 phospholipase C, phosphocholine-specific [Novosphingobium organovorum]
MTDTTRRSVLSATLKGGALGGFAALFPEIARAAAIPAKVGTGTIRDVEHVVILMQENRSFDHYFGTMPGVRGYGDPYPAPAPDLPDGTKRSVLTQLNEKWDGPRVIAPFALNTRQTFAHMRVEDTPHTWPDAQAAWDNGRMARWPEAKHLHSMGHYDAADLGFQYAMAEAFTLCDAYHCSVQLGTNPNRTVLWSGTIDGGAENGGPALGNSHDDLGQYDTPYTWHTYVERLQQAGIDWTVYQDMDDNFTDNPLVGFKAFYDAAKGLPGSDPELVRRGMTTRGLDQLRRDCLAGTLPQVSYVIGTAEGSEHPVPSSPAQGAAYTAQVLEALTANPDVFARTAFFVLFDENDGFFDHVPPPAPPSPDPSQPSGFAGASQISTKNEYHLTRSKADASLERDEFMGRPYGLGARVPAYILSPWSRGGYVTSEVFDHTSVIRFLEARFGVHEPNISPWRRAVCGDMMSAFDFATPNDRPVPAMPDPAPLAARARALPGRTVPPIPAEAVLPVQPEGDRPHRASLYDLEVNWTLNPAAGQIALAFVNRSARAAVFHVYDRHALDAIPRRYTVAGGGRLEGQWALHEAGYDLQVMGPEGFHRRLAGAGSGAASDPAQNDVVVRAAEGTLAGHADAVPYLTVGTDASGLTLHDGRKVRTLKPGHPLPVPVDRQGRYDLSIVREGDAVFLRQFAGRLPGLAS